MSPEPLFQIHLVLGYVARLLCFGAYESRRSTKHFAKRSISFIALSAPPTPRQSRCNPPLFGK
jgi:hypothetical protein